MMLETVKVLSDENSLNCQPDQQENLESSDVNYESLLGLCQNNINFFTNDKSDNGQQLCNSFNVINDTIENIRPIILHLRSVATRHNFEENTPGNGYHSFTLILNEVVVLLIQFNKKVCLKRNNILFRKSSCVKEAESYASLLKSLVVFADALKMLSNNDSLFLMSLSEELMAKTDEVDQQPFYGRNIGFQYCESIRPILRFVSLAMAIFSEAFYSQGSLFSKAKNSVTTTARYLIDPEERSKRIIKIFQYANVDFCKSFWFLAESELMKQVPLVVGQSVAVSKVIQIPPQPLTITADNRVTCVPVPNSHIGKRPVQVRLISYGVREGMIGEAVTKSKLLPPSRGLLIHCHGGGFAAQSSQSHESYLREWAKELEIPILSIDYSLTPQAPYPRALEEVVFAYTWALQNAHLLGTTAERVVCVGDSAGGNLLLGLIQKCIALNLPSPAGILAVYAPTWLTLNISPSRLLLFMDPLIPIGFATRLIKAYISPNRINGKSNGVTAGECLSDTESFEEVSQSDLVELQAHKSPISEASESITCGSLSSPAADAKDMIKQVDISDIDFNVSECDQSTSQNNPSDFLERYVLDSDTETDGTKIAVLKQENVSQEHENSVQARFFSVVANLRNRIGGWVSTRRNGEEIYLDTSKPYNVIEECKLPIISDPFVSPYLASDDVLMKFPSVKLVTTHLDPFLDENVMFASKLKRLGKSVTLDVLPGLPHGFLNFALMSKEAEDGSKLCVKRIKEMLDLENLPTLNVES